MDFARGAGTIDHAIVRTVDANVASTNNGVAVRAQSAGIDYWVDASVDHRRASHPPKCIDLMPLVLQHEYHHGAESLEEMHLGRADLHRHEMHWSLVTGHSLRVLFWAYVYTCSLFALCTFTFSSWRKAIYHVYKAWSYYHFTSVLLIFYDIQPACGPRTISETSHSIKRNDRRILMSQCPKKDHNVLDLDIVVTVLRCQGMSTTMGSEIWILSCSTESIMAQDGDHVA